MPALAITTSGTPKRAMKSGGRALQRRRRRGRRRRRSRRVPAAASRRAASSARGARRARRARPARRSARASAAPMPREPRRRCRCSRRSGTTIRTSGRSARALAISALIAGGSAACVPTLSVAVMNLPSTMIIGTDWTLYCCASALRPVHLAGDRERVVHVLDLLAIEALARRPVEERLVRRTGCAPFLWIAAKTSGDSRSLVAERLERVVDLGEDDPAVLEHHRHAAERDVGRQRLHATPASRARGRRSAGSRTRRTRSPRSSCPVVDRRRVLEADVLLAFLQLLAPAPRRRAASAAKKRRRRAARRGAPGCASIASLSFSMLAGAGAPSDHQRSLVRRGRPEFPRAGGSLPDRRDLESALGEVGARAVHLVDAVVGAEADAVADAPVRAAWPAAAWPPSPTARAAPSGSRRRPRSANDPACSQ